MSLGEDRASAIELALDALRSRGPPVEEALPFRSALEADVRAGTALGVLLKDGDRPVAIAIWDPPSALGAMVTIAHRRAGAQSAAGYRELYAAIAERAGPISFAPGGHAGLSDEAEAALMESLGFGRFGRSEMRFPPNAPTPPFSEPAPARLRSARTHDALALARMHVRAYTDHFDRYLFLTDLDPTVDASHDVAELLAGRWGEFLPWASPVAEEPDALVGAVLVVRAPYGALIADVMVDPAHRRRGLGRSLLVESIHRLRERGETSIVLNVTEGNGSAIRLYERLGFVRSLGPSHGWYSRKQIPVSPGRD